MTVFDSFNIFHRYFTNLEFKYIFFFFAISLTNRLHLYLLKQFSNRINVKRTGVFYVPVFQRGN